MLETLLTSIIVRYHFYRIGLCELAVQLLGYIARGVEELTILAMLATLATVQAIIIVVIGKGLLPFSLGFLIAEILLPSLCVGIVGMMGLLPIRLMVTTANLIKFPPLKMHKAIRRLSAHPVTRLAEKTHDFMDDVRI